MLNAQQKIKNVNSMLAPRLRRWPSIDSTMCQCLFVSHLRPGQMLSTILAMVSDD